MCWHGHKVIMESSFNFSFGVSCIIPINESRKAGIHDFLHTEGKYTG